MISRPYSSGQPAIADLSNDFSNCPQKQFSAVLRPAKAKALPEDCPNADDDDGEVTGDRAKLEHKF